MEDLKVNTQVETAGKQRGLVQIIDNDLVLVWFGGHQRNSLWCSVEELTIV